MASQRPLTASRREVSAALQRARVVFWDFDGVVKDSVAVKTAAFEKLFEAFGVEIVRRVRDHHQANGGVSRYDKIPIYLEWAGEPTNAITVKTYCERFRQIVERSVVASPWVPGVREYLRRNPFTQRFVLVTATPQEEIEAILGAIELRSVFEEVHGAPEAKAKAIHDVLQRWRCAPEMCLMIGDAEADLQAALLNHVPFMLRRTPLNQPVQKSFSGPTFDELVYE